MSAGIEPSLTGSLGNAIDAFNRVLCIASSTVRAIYSCAMSGVLVAGSIGLDGKTYPRRTDPELPERIRQLHKAGWTIREIAAELGCSVGTVHRYGRG